MTITLKNLYKKFDNIIAVNNVSVKINTGEFVSILGPSGCGKSTLLFMISGLTEATDGEIFFDQVNVKNVATEKRNIGMVFQNYSLYPHMTVKDNILFPLKIKKIHKDEMEELLNPIVRLLKLDNLLKRRPHELSGGQQQRVAIGRALIKKPEILLMDEPFSNLDEKLRIEMREEIRSIQKKVGITTLFVTHDQEEAMSISDKIILMNNGKIIQHSNPEVIYKHPKDIFAATFIGKPEINLIHGNIENSIFKSKDIELPVNGFTNEKDVTIAIRPENIVVHNEGNIEGRIIERKTLGREVQGVIEIENRKLTFVYGSDKNIKGIERTFKIKAFHIFKNDKFIGDVVYEE